MADFTEYLWIVIVGGIVAFLTSLGIGANEVANVFGERHAPGRGCRARRLLGMQGLCRDQGLPCTSCIHQKGGVPML